MGRCPRCQVPLLSADLDGIPVTHCPRCVGAWVETRHVIGFLDALAPKLAPDVTANSSLNAAPDPGPVARCPGCGGAPTLGGFMNAPHVRIDHCSKCAASWLDGPEIGTMVRQRAIAAARSADTAQWHAQEREGVNRRLGLQIGRREPRLG